MYETLKIVQKGTIRTIIFNRPNRGNAWNSKAFSEIPDAIADAASDKNTVIGVITGAGKYFTTGLDISDQSQNGGNVLQNKKPTDESLMTSFINFPKPLVAIVNGPTIGGGFTTLALCDLVYSSDKAYFKAPFITLGLHAEASSSYTFPRTMGYAKANEILMLAKTLNAFEAEKLGLITQVFPHDNLQQEAWKRIEELASLPPQALMDSKRLIRSHVKEQMLKANQTEFESIVARMGSQECQTAMRDSLAKLKKKAN